MFLYETEIRRVSKTEVYEKNSCKIIIFGGFCTFRKLENSQRLVSIVIIVIDIETSKLKNDITNFLL